MNFIYQWNSYPYLKKSNYFQTTSFDISHVEQEIIWDENRKFMLCQNRSLLYTFYIFDAFTRYYKTHTIFWQNPLFKILSVMDIKRSKEMKEKVVE